MASTLFRDFSFGASASQHDHEADRAAMNVSPTSPLRHTIASPTFTPPPCSVGELASRLHQHLHVEIESDPSCQWPRDSLLLSLPTNNISISTGTFGPDSQSQSSSSRLSSAVLRMQRQSNTRLQSSSSHVKDISRLVERMVEQEHQCNVRDASKSSSLSSVSSNTSASDNDEAINMDYSADRIPLNALSFRRSSDRLPGSVTISKNIRMRKKSKVCKRHSK